MGVDPRLQDQEGLTPLYTAAAAGHVAIVALLLAHGAAIDEQDN